METAEPLHTAHRPRPEHMPMAALPPCPCAAPPRQVETSAADHPIRPILVQQSMLLLVGGLSRSRVVRALPSTWCDYMSTTFPRISESVDDTPGVGKRLDQNAQMKALAIRPNEAEVRNSPGAKSNTAG